MNPRDFYGTEPRKRRVVVVDGEVVGSAQSGFGAAPAPVMTDAERVFLKGKMEATVAAIRTGFKVARAKVALTPNSLIGSIMAVLTLGLSTIGIQSAPAETKVAVNNALLTLERSFEQQVVGGMQKVYDGTLDPNRWFAMTKLFVDGIRNILNGLEEDGTASNISATFEGMASDTADFLARFKKGVEATFDFMPFIVGGAALLGTYLVVTRLLPQRRLSGYHSRRRKLRLT
ncbi:MAG: hypothetical protein WAV09_03360 [Minisyncoccia bacterium]